MSGRKAAVKNGHAHPHSDAARDGGSNSTTMRRLPQRGQRRRLSKLDNGNARPRVQTSVSISNCLRYVHSRLDFELGPSLRPGRTGPRHASRAKAPRLWSRHPWEQNANIPLKVKRSGGDAMGANNVCSDVAACDWRSVAACQG